jgi:16S rRNA (guanine1207-N2)-methyltransferase
MAGSHYFDTDPQTRSRPGRVALVLKDLRVELHTDAGVFGGSSRQVDSGTVELLKAMPEPPQEGHLLDLGCGYGPIACTLAHRAPGATVWAVDVNERALALTVRNAEELGLGNVRARPPDQVPSDQILDGIWSNPPIRIGKEALHEMLDLWLPRLRAGAQAWLVVQRHLGADSLAAWLESEQGGRWQVARVASKRGYRILRIRHGSGSS